MTVCSSLQIGEMGKGKRRKRGPVAEWIVAGAVAAIALVCVGAPTAVAAPQRGYAVFARCPTHGEIEIGCLYAPLEGGYITLGRVVMPITKTVVLQGGLLNTSYVTKEVLAASGGETLAKVQQTIPGGLFGSPLGAVTELAGPASGISLRAGFGEGNVFLTLPVKVRLVSPLLGGECSIGSNSHPIELGLTTTTSGGLTGNPGKSMSLEEGGILLTRGVSLVSSGFALPKASGCGLAVVDEAIDAKLGLPASKGTFATFNTSREIANGALVEESEG